MRCWAVRDVVFCDAATDTEMRAVVQAGLALKASVVWIGSGGLAGALAEEWYGTVRRPAAPKGPVAVMTGSDHAVSAGQLAVVGADARVLRVERFQTDEGTIREAAAGVRTLVLNGGDTALHVCRALRVRALRIIGEYEAGIAQGVLCGGEFDGMGVVLKSGGFGGRDVIRRLLEAA